MTKTLTKYVFTFVIVLHPVFTYSQWTYAFSNQLYSIEREDSIFISKKINEVHVATYSLLPRLNKQIHIKILFDSIGTIRETSEVGLPLTFDTVQITLNPWSKKRLSEIINDNFSSTLLHELHHLARGWVLKGRAPSRTFMDAVVAEGMATCFERDFGKVKPPAANYPNNVIEWVDELLGLPSSAFKNYYQWMIQHPDGRRWIGYKAGAFIVDRAMEKSMKSSAELVNVSTEEILRLAGF